MYTSKMRAVVVKGARFMPCSLTDDESGKTYELNIKEPKLKIYKQFEKLNKESTTDDIIEVASVILSGNKEGIKISPEFIEENMSLEEITDFFTDFSDWILAARKSDPN